MDIQNVLKEMRDIADDEWEGVAPAVTIERWADAIEAAMRKCDYWRDKAKDQHTEIKRLLERTEQIK